MHQEYRMVENVFEELDAPGEWFHNRKTDTLFFYPPAGLDLRNATVEGVRLESLIQLRGSQEHPVRFVTFDGFVLRHTARTFMENREPLFRSDCTIYRAGRSRSRDRRTVRRPTRLSTSPAPTRSSLTTTIAACCLLDSMLLIAAHAGSLSWASERRACSAMGFPRGSHRYVSRRDERVELRNPSRKGHRRRRYDKTRYKLRNHIEQFFNRLKHFRRIATRYEKTDRNFEGFLSLAAVLVTAA